MARPKPILTRIGFLLSRTLKLLKSIKGVMMLRILILTLVFYLVLLPVIPIRGQNILFSPYNVLIEKDNLLNVAIVPPAIKSFSDAPVQIDHPLSNAIYNMPVYLRIESNELFYNWLKEPELKPFDKAVNRNAFNALYNKPKVDEKKEIREAWKKAFGFDVWLPYYKAKEVEKWVKKRLSVKIFKLKGEPEFARDQIMYTFKTKF